MYISQGTYAAYVFWSFLCGILCGILYDMFRILRISTAPQTKEKAIGADAGEAVHACKGLKEHIRRHYERIFLAAVFLEDLLYSLICACVFAVVTYQTNYGRFRWFAFAAYAGGFVLYYFTVGRLVIGAAGWIISMIRKLIRFVLSLTVLPMVRLLRWFGGKTGNAVCRTAGRFRTYRAERRMLRYAEKGFGFAVPEKTPMLNKEKTNGGSGKISGTGKERSLK